MSSPMPAEGRATLVHSYRNLSEREIRKRLEGPLSDAERVTAQAELLRREDDGPDTTFVTGFAPTGAFEGDADAQEAALAEPGAAPPARARAAWLALPLLAACAMALGWAWHAGLLHR